MNDKRDQIIEAALLLFGEKGFSAVSIKEIAQLAGVSQVTIYNHFKNKEGLVEKATAILMDDVLAAADQVYASDLPYEEKLIKAFDVCGSQTAQAIEQYFSGESLTDPKLAALILQAVNLRKEEIYLKFIELGYTLQKISSEIDKQSILFLLRALNASSLATDNAQDTASLTKDLVHLFLYGIIGKKNADIQELTGEEVLQLLTKQVKYELEKGEE